MAFLAKLGLLPAVKLGNLITAGLEKVTGKTYGRQTTEGLAATPAGKVLGIATVGTAAALGVAAFPTAAKSLIPTTLKGKLIGIAAVPVVGGVLSANPKAPLQLGTALGNVGSNVGKFSADPSLATAKDLITENPLLVGGGILALTGGAALAALPAISAYRSRKATEENTQAILASNQPSQQIITQPMQMQTLETAPTMPMGAETINLPKSPSGKRKKSRSRPQGQIIKQSVRVNVINTNSSRSYGSKRYLNMIPVRN